MHPDNCESPSGAANAFLAQIDGVAMRLIATLSRFSNEWIPRLASPVLLLTRLYVARVFLVSGYLKVTNWDQTVGLFTSEYHVPLLSPTLAAVAGSFGELFFPALLVLGIGTRAAAIGLFAVNAMAVYSYRQVLLAEGFEAAFGQHLLWGYMLVTLAAFGAGRLSLDAWLAARGRAGSASLRRVPQFGGSS
jgi:putative oxidoreductase